jgi:hypothetical protein
MSISLGQVRHISEERVMAKKMIIAVIVLIDLCTGLSLLKVRSGSFRPATLWNAAEVNVLHVRSRAVQYFEGIRLIYDVARQRKLSGDRGS